jgi:hypothetical protein
MAIGLFSGCIAADAASSSAEKPTPSAEGSWTNEGPPADAAIAATCAGFSAFDSVVTDAKHRLDGGEISEAEYTLVLQSGFYGFATLRGEENQRGLRSEVAKLLDSAGGSTAAAAGALDPRNDEYTQAANALFQACETNSSTVVISAQGG